MILPLAQLLAPTPVAVPDAASLALTGFNPYNPIVIAMIGTQICLIIAAVAQAILSILAHTDRKAVADQIQSVAKDTEAIKGHVNSEKTAAEGRETALRQENHLLREMLTEGKSTAALLAQAVATRARTADHPPAPSGAIDVQKVEVVNTPLATIEVAKEVTR